MTGTKPLCCANGHAPNGVIVFRDLGYREKAIDKLTGPELYPKKLDEKQKEEW